VNAFRYFEAATPQNAIGLLAGEPHGTFLAGGTLLIDLMKQRVELPDALIDINRLPLAEIEEQGGALHIGAMVRNSDLAYHPAVRSRYPMLSEALLSGASPQLRNMATVGGNIMQRTRCPYFRDPELPCNKREPNTGCGAIAGYHRMHAILGTSDKCIAVHPSDMCVALVALDAIVHLESAVGQRSVPLIEFHLLPGDTPEEETVLRRGELITALEIPDLPFARRSTYLKVRDRASYEFALTSAAVAVEVKDGKIRAARVALGGVGTKPWRAHEAERVLEGSAPRESVYRQAAEAALAGARPGSQNKFKLELAKETIVRALEQVEELR
jgi:xanthine dehydrogenase YagS FAD-binding subunit